MSDEVIVCGQDAVQRLVAKDGPWWVVFERNQDGKWDAAVSGGWKRKSDALADARRIGGTR